MAHCARAKRLHRESNLIVDVNKVYFSDRCVKVWSARVCRRATWQKDQSSIWFYELHFFFILVYDER